MKLIYERAYGDGCVLSVKEMPHPILEVPCVAIQFDAGGGKGITAYLSDLAGEDFSGEFVAALEKYISDQHIEDTKDSLEIITSEKGDK